MIDNERYMHLWVWERCIHNDTRMKRGYISILLKRVVYVPFMNVVLNSLVICFHLLCFLVFAYSLHFLASPCILQLWSSCWIPRPLLDFASLSAHMTFVKHVTYLKLGLAVGKIDVMYWQGSIPYMKWFLNREIAWTRRPSHATIHYTSVCKGAQPWVALVPRESIYLQDSLPDQLPCSSLAQSMLMHHINWSKFGCRSSHTLSNCCSEVKVRIARILHVLTDLFVLLHNSKSSVRDGEMN